MSILDIFRAKVPGGFSLSYARRPMIGESDTSHFALMDQGLTPFTPVGTGVRPFLSLAPLQPPQSIANMTVREIGLPMIADQIYGQPLSIKPAGGM